MSVESVGKQILMSIWTVEKGSKKEAIRSTMPILKDLIGIYPMLLKGSVSFKTQTYKNEWLNDLNSGFSLTGGKIFTMDGVGEKTPWKIKLKEITLVDKVLGLWEEGSFSGTVNDDGDNTVVESSSKIDGVAYQLLSSRHREIVDLTVPQVLEKLGLSGVNVTASVSSDMSNYLVFFIGSPANIAVDCGFGNMLSDLDGFVKIPRSDKCKVSVIGTGKGIYYLYAVDGKDTGTWHYFEDILIIIKQRVLCMTFQTRDLLWLKTKRMLGLL